MMARNGKLVRMILARAGATDYDDQDRIIGNLDIPLNIRGQAELSAMARALAGEKIETIYTAAGAAAGESARALGDHLGVRVRVLEDLRNIDFGLWQGLPVDDVRRRHRRTFKQWEESPLAICPPAGESLDLVVERVRRGLKCVLRRHGGETIVLIAPDPLRQVIRCQLQRHSPARLLEKSEDEPLWEIQELAAEAVE